MVRDHRSRLQALPRKIKINLTLPGPVRPHVHKPSSDRIISHISPLFNIRLLTPQHVVEKPLLPNRLRYRCLPNQSFCCPLLPLANKLREISFCAAWMSHAEKMHMIWHDDIAPNQPAMTFSCRHPFLLQNGKNLRVVENAGTSLTASRDEVNCIRNGNSLQPMQMLLHVWLFSIHC